MYVWLCTCGNAFLSFVCLSRSVYLSVWVTLISSSISPTRMAEAVYFVSEEVRGRGWVMQLKLGSLFRQELGCSTVTCGRERGREVLCRQLQSWRVFLSSSSTQSILPPWKSGLAHLLLSHLPPLQQHVLVLWIPCARLASPLPILPCNSSPAAVSLPPASSRGPYPPRFFLPMLMCSLKEASSRNLQLGVSPERRKSRISLTQMFP